MKFSKNRIHPQNNLTPNATLNKGLAMPCVNCIVMGFATNLVLIPSHSVAYGVMNEFVTLKSKR